MYSKQPKIFHYFVVLQIKYSRQHEGRLGNNLFQFLECSPESAFLSLMIQRRKILICSKSSQKNVFRKQNQMNHHKELGGRHLERNQFHHLKTTSQVRLVVLPLQVKPNLLHSYAQLYYLDYRQILCPILLDTNQYFLLQYYYVGHFEDLLQYLNKYLCFIT